MAPSRIIGPSRPSEPPLPTVAMAARALTSTGRGAILPPDRATASISDAIPSPLASPLSRRRPSHRMSPTRAPPMASGTTTIQRGWIFGAISSRSPVPPQRSRWRRLIRNSVTSPSRPPTTPTRPISRKKIRSSRLARPKRRARVKSSERTQSRTRRSQAMDRISMQRNVSSRWGTGVPIRPCRARSKLLFHRHAHSCIMVMRSRLRATEAFRGSAGERPPSVLGSPTAEVPPPRYQPSFRGPAARHEFKGTGNGPLRLFCASAPAAA